MSSPHPSRDYRFGRFTLQPAAQRLLADGDPAPLGPRAFDLLVVLVERAGQMVSKSELLDLVWPGVVVEENNLQVQVSALRKILGPEAIATIPGRGYRFTLAVAESDAGPASAAPSAPAPVAADPGDAPSIAVLPFVNMSDDAANEYFAEGLSEELLNVLSKIRGLRVASRTSAFSFKGTGVDIPTVARKLNVARVLEGSVRKAGTRVRITAQLVDVATDSHLWSETYERELEDIFAVQDDIARSVVKEMRAALLGGHASAPADVTAEVRVAARGRSANPEAYRLYLEGLFFEKRYNRTDIAKAIDAFRRAVELDPGFAVAWAALSFAYFSQEANAWAPIAEGAEHAREAAMRALAVGPDVAASHWALGAIQMYCDWDWQGAEASVRRALDLAPEDSHLVLAAKLMHSLGKLDEAARLVQEALSLDPLNVEAHVTAGRQGLYTRRPVEAEGAFRKALELSPDRRVRVHFELGVACMLQGRLNHALREFEQEAHETFRLLGIAVAQHAQGRADESNSALRELTRKYAQGGAYQIAEAHACRGDVESAFAWLERAYEQRDAGLASLKIDPLLENLHADSRWRPWLDRMRLAD